MGRVQLMFRHAEQMLLVVLVPILEPDTVSRAVHTGLASQGGSSVQEQVPAVAIPSGGMEAWQ